MFAATKAALRPVYQSLGLGAARRRIRNTRWYFDRVLASYIASHPMQAPRPATDPNLATLLAEGVVVLPELHQPALVRAVHDRVRNAMERIRQGAADPAWRTLIYREDGIYRLEDVDVVVPEIRAILDHPYPRSLAHAYLGGQIRAERNYVDYKPDLVHDHTTQLHMDSWQSQVKVFTLLCDVDEARAPLVYWKGTHRDGEWRRRFDHLFWTGDDVGVAGMFPAHVLRRLAKADPTIREAVMTATAGTAIVADTRGVHRASDLREGYRLELVQKFTQPVVS
jgi:Phytanoyl-CoA dioxygenase (PhyH)